MTMATWDVTVQGVPLNTLAYQVDVIEGRRSLPARENQGLSVSGLHGEVGGVGSYQPNLYGIAGWIDAVNPATGVMPANWEEQLELNIDTFLRAFQTRSGVVDVLVAQPNGTIRRAMSSLAGPTVIDKISPRTVRVKVPLKIPSAFWEGYILETYTSSAVGTWQTMTPFSGGTGVISDALIKVHGPTTSSTTVQTPDGGRLSLLRTLASNEVWIADANTGRSQVGIEITAANQGSSVHPLTDYAGSGVRLLELWPEPSGIYRVAVTTTAGSGFWWSITANPKYL